MSREKKAFPAYFFQALQILVLGGKFFEKYVEEPQILPYSRLNLKLRSECICLFLTFQETWNSSYLPFLLHEHREGH